VQPVEIARKLAKEMDAHKTASVQRVYVPNEYTVWLCPDDYERFKDYESSLAQELSGHLLEHARHHDYDLLTRPVVHLDQDERRRSNVGDWQIVDLNSTNGVKVNGRRVANARLSPGDEITLGTKVFAFDIEQ
jgi:hypothetical protein